MSDFIQIRDIHLSYGEQELFRDFSLNIAKGETVQLKGPSGRGKSTLMKMLPGFVRPDSGTISIGGQDLNRRSLRQIREGISYVSQDTDFRNIRVSELLDEIFSFKMNKHRTIPREELLSYFDDFRLNHGALDKTVRELSGGERQRLGIIITLTLDREIWLLDEVTSALDPELKAFAVETMLAKGKTILLCSHDREWESDSRVRVVEL